MKLDMVVDIQVFTNANFYFEENFLIRSIEVPPKGVFWSILIK